MRRGAERFHGKSAARSKFPDVSEPKLKVAVTRGRERALHSHNFDAVNKHVLSLRWREVSAKTKSACNSGGTRASWRVFIWMFYVILMSTNMRRGNNTIPSSRTRPPALITLFTLKSILFNRDILNVSTIEAHRDSKYLTLGVPRRAVCFRQYIREYMAMDTRSYTPTRRRTFLFIVVWDAKFRAAELS